MKPLLLWGPVVAWMGVLFALSVRSSLPGGELVWDKVAHAVAYGTLAWLCLRATHGGLEPLRLLPTLLAVAVTLTYGALAEWQQSMVPGRDASVLDWVADAVGALLALPAAQFMARIVRSTARTDP